MGLCQSQCYVAHSNEVTSAVTGAQMLDVILQPLRNPSLKRFGDWEFSCTQHSGTQDEMWAKEHFWLFLSTFCMQVSPQPDVLAPGFDL